MESVIICKWKSCASQFKTHKECFEHVRSIHIGAKVVNCSWGTCTAKRTTKWNLVNHMNCHLEMVRGVCHLCNRSFKWKGDYRRHMVKHSAGESNFNEVACLLFDYK